MVAHVNLSTALLRARARRDVVRALEPLSPSDARALLLDLYAEIEIESEDAPAEEEEEEEQEEEAPPSEESGKSEPRRGDGSYSDRLKKTLAANPKMPIGDLAVAIYGISDSGTRAKTRSLLSALGGRGEVQNVGEGEWIVAEKEATKTKS